LSPINLVAANIVGFGNSSGTTFISGSGTITYQSPGGQLTPVLVGNPTCENSNITYQQISACPASSISQGFGFNPRTCTTIYGSCTGASTSEVDSCVPGPIPCGPSQQCCHANWLYGWKPYVVKCSDGAIVDWGCSGPCYW
jgi:hypothetical protein